MAMSELGRERGTRTKTKTVNKLRPKSRVHIRLSMTILGIGVDVLHLPRLTRHLADNRLARRILSPAELCEYLALPKEDHGRRIRFLGVRCALFLR